jgi:hypothetical protein
LELAFPSQFFITLVYWTVLHTYILEYLEAMETFDYIAYYIYIFVHIQPFISVVIQIYVSKVKFISSHRFYMIPLGVAYLFVNYCGTKYYGEPLYPFLSWVDYKSPLIGSMLVVIGYYSFDFFCRIVNRLEFITDKKSSND